MDQTFNMTREENILFAKRNLVDSIWKEARLEGLGVTFPQTREVFEGRAVSGMTVDETVAINNLKHAWQFVLDTLDAPIDLMYVRQVNHLIGQGLVLRAGDIRDMPVSIGGTSWRPETYDYDGAMGVVAAIGGARAGEEAALVAFARLARAQLFFDGNKRTAQLVANKMLIAGGAGVFAVPVEEREGFLERLVLYYEMGDEAGFVEYLRASCLDGLLPSKPQPPLEYQW